jgi:hypothetical protein
LGKPHTATGEATKAWPYRRLYSGVSSLPLAAQQSLTLNDYRIQPVALAPFGPTHPTSVSAAVFFLDLLGPGFGVPLAFLLSLARMLNYVAQE